MAKMATKGSQKWLQILVNYHAARLSSFITNKPESAETRIDWVSPLQKYGFKEYKDKAVFDQLKISGKSKDSMRDFWPLSGPRWDALGVHKGNFYLVEAKSYCEEMNSRCGATSRKSIEKITESLEKTADALGATFNQSWKNDYYQYANRIAHLYYFREMHGIPAYLVFINFLNDSTVRKSPSKKEEWESHLKMIDKKLGIPTEHSLKEFIVHLYIDLAPQFRSL